jgi:acylphosphatase
MHFYYSMFSQANPDHVPSKFTQQKARAYNITGFVRNERDGSVFGEAQGQKDDLDKLVADLHEGPPHAQVSKVDRHDISAKDGEGGFEV